MFSVRKKYKVINLFKVSDIKIAKDFDFKKHTINSMRFLEGKGCGSFNNIEINFGQKRWKTLSGYQKGVSNLGNYNIVNMMSYTKDNSLILSIHNLLMNLENPPKNGFIDITLAISNRFYSESFVIKFIENLLEEFEIDYGYFIDLDKKNIFNENKNKKPNFLFYSIGVKEGFIKKLYKLNILNDSHVEQPIIKQLIAEGIGDLEKLNNDIFIWRLNDQDFKVANDKLNNSKYVIFNEDNPDLFLQTEEAKRFNDLMKLR